MVFISNEPVMPSSNYLHIHSTITILWEGVNVFLVLNCSELILIPDIARKKIVFRMFHSKKMFTEPIERVYDKLRMIIPKVAYVYSSRWRYRKNDGRKIRFFSSVKCQKSFEVEKNFFFALLFGLRCLLSMCTWGDTRGESECFTLYHMEHINLDNNLLCSCFLQECNDGE